MAPLSSSFAGRSSTRTHDCRNYTIYIYDGLTDRDVQRALDDEFERVDSMMFIRTRKTDEDGKIKRDEDTGEVEVEGDGC